MEARGAAEASIEAQVLAVRDAHPAWGARKIAHCLQRDGVTPPALSTVHEILRRSGRIVPPPGAPPHTYARFEKEAPNQLWQMDFKGRMPLTNGAACHPLTMIDDHSRYALCIGACANEQSPTVQQQLTATFRRYGMPDAFFVDNGSPWGGSGDRHGPVCESGCCGSGSMSSMPGPIIRKAVARMNASIAP
jgi:transposase InsO family protein